MMRRRVTALALACLMLLSLLTGCAKKPDKAEEFYALADEIKGLQAAKVSMTMPYHGAVLRTEGFVSRENKTADLTFSLEGSDQDGTWTRMLVEGNEVWLDVGQMADFTLAQPLSDQRRGEIQALADKQSQRWMYYYVEGALWEGLPGWKELLSGLWQDSKADLKGCITADGENGYLLKLEGKSLEQSGGAVAQRIRDHCEAYEAGFQEFWEEQITLKYAVPRTVREMFADVWQRVLHEELPAGEESQVIDLDGPEAEPVQDQEDGDAAVEQESVPLTEQEPVKSVELRLSHEGEDYGVALRHNGAEVFTLTLTPAEDPLTQTPEDIMTLEEYIDSFYDLISLSRDYVNAILDGTQEAEEEDPHGHEHQEEPTEDPLMPMNTTPVQGYEGIALIQYQTEAGGVMQVPVLTGYTESTVDSENLEGNLVREAYLSAPGWSQQIYTIDAAGSPAEDAGKEMQEYFDLYVGASGAQVIEERSEVAVSSDGTAAICGFSMQNSPYESIMGRVIIILRQKDAKADTVLDLYLDLDKMTDAQRNQVESLCAYLGVNVPIQLKYE